MNGPEPNKLDENAVQHSNSRNQAKGDQRHILIVLPQLSLASRYYATAAFDKAFAKHLLDDSEVAIVDGSSGSYPFESDGKLLKRTIRRIRRVTSNPCTGGGSWLPAAVQRLAQMRSMSDRKFLVFFTDFETDPSCPPGWLLRSGNSPWMLLRESLDANVAMYPIDTRASVPIIPFGGASTQAYFGPDVGTRTSGNVGGTGQSTILAEESESLSEVAAETGGRALVGNRDLFLAFQSIREDSACYELGYYLPDLQADAGFTL